MYILEPHIYRLVHWTVAKQRNRSGHKSLLHSKPVMGA